ncbi:purine-cytosine permease family protein [Solimicrobium silvestre]|uniref:Purine-cytosine permease n=1 Tax=Solimicrobium silvestre TaxID=2099400 RepID=A0A2S9GTU7_9BURK|nr:cytosine permease [Solimicrobium silvestre]PRC91155.1 Purine-cytosine permease [Solimicrobium silvestre]
MALDSSGNTQKKSLIETRSIDYIPESERHGHLLSQFTLWFGTNLQITAIVTGALAVVLGGDVFWSLFGLLIGQILGGSVMALHAAQGPHLGLPQMISSRVQFGVYGAVIPIVLVCVLYVGFSATGTVLAGQSIAKLLDTTNSTGILLFGALIVVLTLFGYRLIHLIGRAASVIGIIAFVYLFSSLVMQFNLTELLMNNRHFTLAHFLLAISLSASWQIAYGPYVADYSRYLPSTISPIKTFLAVGGGSVLGTQISMTLGVFAAALAGKQFAGNELNYIVSLGGTGIIASFLYFSIIFGKIIATTLNSYGSFMSIATIVSGFRGNRQISPVVRFIYIFSMVGLATGLALAGQYSFLTIFKSFILFLLAFFTPWSAINLVDYYWVTKGRYDLKALSDPNGRYGAWNKIGISTYVIGVVIQMPFLATGFYTGPMVAHLGDTDISWIIGLVIPGILYYFAMKKWPYEIPEKLILPDAVCVDEAVFEGSELQAS